MNSTSVLALLIGAAAVVGVPFFNGTFQGRSARPVLVQAAATNDPAAARRAEIYADAHGHYQAMVEIDHHLIPMLVDTGATSVALSFEDAEALGLRLSAQEFHLPISTANGIAYAARAQLRSVRIGTVEVAYVDAVVMPRGAMRGSLLGMAFLGQISVTSSKNRLLLTQ